MRGFIAGLTFAILALIVGLVYWLYGSKIKQDINDKINNDNQTIETQSAQQAQNYVVLDIAYQI